MFKIKKRHEVLVDKNNVNDVVMSATSNGVTGFRIGNCGWLKAPDCYFIAFTATLKQYASIMEDLNNKEIKILPESVGY